MNCKPNNHNCKCLPKIHTYLHVVSVPSTARDLDFFCVCIFYVVSGSYILVTDGYCKELHIFFHGTNTTKTMFNFSKTEI